MSNWTLNNTPAAALGVSDIDLQTKSQDADECTLHVARPFDAASLFAHGTTVTLRKDGAQYFVGRCDQDPRKGSARREDHTVKLMGPWWYLKHRNYRQIWKLVTDPTANPIQITDVLTTNVILGMNYDGQRVASGAVIRDALQFAINMGAPFQIGTITAGVLIPMDQAIDITCDEVIHRCLRYTPDAVSDVDYSTMPPTINIRRRGELASVTLPATAASGVNVSEVECAPCWSLKLSGVVCYFCVDSSPFPSVTQSAGVTTGFEVQETTIHLAGAQQNIILNKVEVEDLPSTANSVAWWTDKYPWLKDVSTLTLRDGDLGDDNNYGKRLIKGSITDWMVDNQNVNVADAVATVKADYELGGTTYRDQVLSLKYKATDADSKAYTFGDGGTPAELVPAGLAAAILSACSVLHWEGSLTLVEQECGRKLMGKVLNLSGGMAEWSTMNALIVGTTERLFRGTTVVQYGPPPCLSSGDLMALNRANRIRLPAGKAGAKKKGGTDTDNEPSVGGDGAEGSTAGGQPKMSKVTVAKADGTKSIVFDASASGATIALTSGSKSITLDPDDTSDTTFNLLFITDYGTTGAALHSIPVQKKGNVLVITGAPTDLSPYSCPGS